VELQCEVIAISVDHIYAHNVFNASLGMLPYPLASDWYKKTCKDYGVYDEQKQVAKRSVFLIDKKGIIRFVNKQFDANKADDYAEVFKQLKN
jgi:peroxiredoxin